LCLMVWQMAIAAVAHVFVFSAEPYHYIPASEYGKVTTERTKGEVKLEGDTPAVLEKQETKVEAPGTSVTESVQDIVLKGGQHVVKDVVLTINQAMGPVEKGVTKIQETFHRKSVSSDKEVDESELRVEQYEENLTCETHIP
ncbi:protein LAZ1 homolog 2, partial [Morus notabilis]|uniref:protein LAZ1 homolog 2 n=1 Tax=Morus notabilis TaxID=981085 RepID=UPI000CED4DAD